MLPILSLILSVLVFLALILGLVLKPSVARRLSTVFMAIGVVGGLLIYGIGYAEAFQDDLVLTAIRTPMTVIRMQPKFIDSVAERMKLDGTLDQVGGMEYLVELTRHISSTRQLRTYAQIMAVKVCLSK